MKINLLIFYLFSYLNSTDFYNEFPGIENFLQSSLFLKKIDGGRIIWARDVLPYIAQVKKKNKEIILNKNYVNRYFFNTEEVKFILSHELGHISTKKYDYQRYFLAASISSLSMSSYCLNTFGFSASSAILSLVGFTALKKIMSNSELDADIEGIKISLNKQAAISTLLKREKIFPESGKSILDFHPSVAKRIEHIEKIF